MTIETIPGTKDVANRMVDAANNFADRVAEKINLDRTAGMHVLNFFIKHKLVKIDLTNRTYNVRHGGLLEADVLQRAYEAAK